MKLSQLHLVIILIFIQNSIAQKGSRYVNKTGPARIGGFFSNAFAKTVSFISDVTYNALSRSGNEIQFLLYNKKDTTKGEIFTPGDRNKRSIWIYGYRVKILIHGYKESGTSTDDTPAVSQGIKDDYMYTDTRVNVIIVDWNSLSKETNYYDSAKNTKIVGQAVGEFILMLNEWSYIQSYDAVHIVGFSLGAQTAGIAGYHVYKKSGQKIKRITGLDPAGPGFESRVSEADRLDRYDAHFVDVMHCDNGKQTDGHWGTDLVCGTVDFYPNGGKVQPGCNQGTLFTNLVIGSCSHAYCPQLFRETIYGARYYGCRCQNWQKFQNGLCNCGTSGPIMGEYCPHGVTGIYYMRATV